MIIESEQEMLDFGANLAKKITNHSSLVGDTAWGTPNRATARMGEDAAAGPAGATVVELVGDVGAGKTTFVRGLAKGLGIKEPVTSPSFTISKSYALPTGGRLIHYDFYRLQDPGLMSEDLTENLESPNNIIVIEWGESISDLLPNNHTIIKIDYNEDGSRNISINNV